MAAKYHQLILTAGSLEEYKCDLMDLKTAVVGIIRRAKCTWEKVQSGGQEDMDELLKIEALMAY